MKHRALGFLIQTIMLYMGLRLIAEFAYVIYCVLLGVTFDNGVLQVLKFISLVVAVALVVAHFINERKEILVLSKTTGYSFDTIAYARFKMYMSPDSIIKEWNLDDIVECHKKT